MRLFATLFVLLASVPLIGLADNNTPPRLINIIASDDLKFSLPTITAARSERLRVRLHVRSQMPPVAMAHNFVLLKIGTDINKLVLEGARHRDRDFIPPSMASSVIVNTVMAGGNQRMEVTFTAPARPGDYPYICTFAGHYQAGMKGTLTVK